MTTVSDSIKVFGNYTHFITVDLVSQNIANNTSVIRWSFYIRHDKFTGAWGTASWSGKVNNVNKSGTKSYDFGGSTDQIKIATGTQTVAHNSNGTKAIGLQFSWPWQTSGMPGGYTSGVINIKTIPRKSYSTYSPSRVEMGTSMTIYTNAASTAFRHVVSYKFGNKTGQIGTGIASSKTWTPPVSLATEITNSTTGSGTLYVNTYTKNGGTYIGRTSRSLDLKVSSGTKPSAGSVSALEGNPAVSSVISEFVQGVSKVQANVTGAVGTYGSTIKSYKIEVNGQTFTSSSALTEFLASAGPKTVLATVTDSRGRTATTSTSYTVLSYAPPKVNSVTVERALSNGVLDDDGTHAKVTMKVTATSLKQGGVTEKNALKYTIASRLRNVGTFSVRTGPNNTSLSTNASVVVPNSIYEIDKAWEFLTTFDDRFADSSKLTTLATAEIFMHWGPNGLGLGKYHQRGKLDVAGDIYGSGDIHGGGKIWAEPGVNVLASSGTDLNDYKATGFYRQNLSAGAQSGLNYPANVAGLLEVVNADSMFYQRFTTYQPGNNIVYVRTWYGGAWGPWETTSPRAPTAAGTYNLTAVSANGGFSGWKTVSFPGGRFSSAPAVTAISNSGRLNLAISNITATNFRVAANNWTSAIASAGPVEWVAVGK